MTRIWICIPALFVAALSFQNDASALDQAKGKTAIPKQTKAGTVAIAPSICVKRGGQVIPSFACASGEICFYSGAPKQSGYFCIQRQ